MIRITRSIALGEEEISESFVRSSGPGGQRVNKVSTAVHLRFDLGRSTSLPEDVKARLKKIAGRRLTDAGLLVIRAQRYRSQEKNRQDARQRLINLIRKAVQPPKRRKKTRLSATSRAQRLENKRHRSRIKKMRQAPEINKY